MTDRLRQTDLSEIWDDLFIAHTIWQVQTLINSPEVHKPLTGTWLDLGSNGGKVTKRIQEANGIDRIIWVDTTKPRENDPASNPGNNRFIEKDVTQLLNSGAINNEKINGIFIVNPWPDQNFLEAAFEIAMKKLTAREHVIVVCEKEVGDPLLTPSENDMEQIVRRLASNHGLKRSRGLQNFDHGIGLVFEKS